MQIAPGIPVRDITPVKNPHIRRRVGRLAFDVLRPMHNVIRIDPGDPVPGCLVEGELASRGKVLAPRKFGDTIRIPTGDVSGGIAGARIHHNDFIHGTVQAVQTAP
jgi:hypothetical protein